MYGLEKLTYPDSPYQESEPLDIEEVKLHSHITLDDEDELLEDLIASARQLFEEETGRQLGLGTYRMYLDSWVSPLYLPKPPLVGVASVKYYDTVGVLQTLDSSTYTVDAKRMPGRVWFESMPALSSTHHPKIIVEFHCGYSVVPQLIRQALLLLVADWYAHRETSIDKSLSELPYGFQRVANRYKTGMISSMGAK